MSFWITLGIFGALAAIAECLRPRPDVDETEERGLCDSRMVIVPDGEIWAPGQPNASPCTWCGAALRLDKRGNCVNCGGEVL